MAPANLTALDYFTREGGIFTVATGRAHPTFAPHARCAPINAPVVLSNGSALYDFHEDRMVYETFLPQRDGGCVAELPEIIEGLPKRDYLFKLDCEHMDWCEAVLFVFDGRVPDEGACFELGYCYAKGKRCIGYKTDARCFIDGFDNVMLHGAPEKVLRSEDELRAFFSVLS